MAEQSSRSSSTIELPTRPASDDAPSAIADDESPVSQRDAERYAVERVLGKGGMGTVFLVRDNVIGRHIALKKVHVDESDAADLAAVARFRREARVQGQLEHPAVVPVYDVGVSDDGKPFFTMKRVRGQSLAEVLRAPTKPGRRKLLTAFSQVCLAVHYAHERGVVHRDIKPSNIMLGSYGEVYLLDWGVAKLASDTSELGPHELVSAGDASGIATGAGRIMGTPSTMAPEQAVGGRVDARTDVYALGAVLFQILTGEPLHPRGNADEVLTQIARGVDARASVRVPDADVPPELEAICVNATRLEPNDRFASAKEIHDAIEAYLDGDRDLSARREAARRYAERAKELAARQTDDDREVALREVGRALAFDPENKDALATLVKLLTTPPKTVPREVAAEQLALLRRHQRIGGIAASVLYAYILSTGLHGLLFGASRWNAFLGQEILWACALASGLLTIWKPSYVALIPTYVFGVMGCAMLAETYSPYVMLPPLLGLHVVLYSFVRPWSLRIFIVLVAVAAWTFAVNADRWGLLSRTVEHRGGELVLHLHAAGAPSTAMTSFLYVSILAMLVAPSIVLGTFRMAWHRADGATRMQAWQLRRLVSDEKIITDDAASR